MEVLNIKFHLTSWYTSVTTEIRGEELDDRRIAARFPAGPIDLLFSETSRQAVGPTIPIQCYWGPLVGTATGA